MIVALFALAAALVIGGSAAVVQGFPFVRLESGLAMVIAGASTASAGAILFGLGVVCLGLKRIEKGLKMRREAEAGPVPVPPPVSSLGAVFPEPPRPSRPILPGLTGLAAGALGGTAAATAEKRPSEPTFEDSLFAPAPPDPRQPELPIPAPEPEASPEAHRQGRQEPFLEEPPIEEPHRERPAHAAEPDDGIAPEDDLLAGPVPPEPAPAAQAETEAPALRSSLDAAPETAAPEPEEVAEKPAREVVGKYASGGNTYVMYADGSIEAETPRGRFNFASLDELKAFIDAGGEGAARGAA
jgi:hypothetical protein